jgi:radical SAM superfamily enzyme YgiQ (UPF0313 family)
MKKKTVVLVNPPLTSKERLYKGLSKVKVNYPPLGLCYLASVIRHKYNVKIIDLQIENMNFQYYANYVLQQNPDYIGITSTTVAIHNAARIAKIIKSKKNSITIILGGPHITALPKKTMEIFPFFDIGIIGEAEITFKKLLNNLENNLDLKATKGLVIRKKNKIILCPKRDYISNLNDLPFPAFDLLPDFTNYGGSQFIDFENRKTFRLITSRGCPHICSFCDKNIFGKKYRAHNAEYIMSMIKVLYNKHKIRHIYFSDDNFTLLKKRVIKLCNKIIKEKLDLSWACNARVDQVDLNLLKQMKKAGCHHIAYGIESGSQIILDILKKGITLKQVKDAIKNTNKAGIEARGNFILGCPGETRATIKKTIKFAQNLDLNTFKLSFFTPFPGTEIYNNIYKYDSFKLDWKKLSKYNPVFVPKGFTKKELDYYYRLVYRKFYFRPKMVFYYLKKIRNFQQLKSALQKFLILLNFVFKNKKK